MGLRRTTLIVHNYSSILHGRVFPYARRKLALSITISVRCWKVPIVCWKCNLISLFKLLAFPFNITFIVCAIINSSTMFYHCDLLCTKVRVFMWLYLTVIMFNKDSSIHCFEGNPLGQSWRKQHGEGECVQDDVCRGDKRGWSNIQLVRQVRTEGGCWHKKIQVQGYKLVSSCLPWWQTRLDGHSTCQGSTEGGGCRHQKRKVPGHKLVPSYNTQVHDVDFF